LPENCWFDNYFDPRTEAENALLEKHSREKVLNEYSEESRHEINLYSKYSQYYGYVFYIGKKLQE
jgi:hypothetical protein